MDQQLLSHSPGSSGLLFRWRFTESGSDQPDAPIWHRPSSTIQSFDVVSLYSYLFTPAESYPIRSLSALSTSQSSLHNLRGRLRSRCLQTSAKRTIPSVAPLLGSRDYICGRAERARVQSNSRTRVDPHTRCEVAGPLWTYRGAERCNPEVDRIPRCLPGGRAKPIELGKVMVVAFRMPYHSGSDELGSRSPVVGRAISYRILITFSRLFISSGTIPVLSSNTIGFSNELSFESPR